MSGVTTTPAPSSASSADYSLQIAGVDLTPTSLTVSDGSMSQERWEAVLGRLRETQNGVRWWLGDLLAFGERSYGDGTYQRLAKVLNYEVGSLRNLASVSRRVAPEQRRSDLPWRTHRVVAKFDPAEQADWLDLADDEGWSADELKTAIAASKFTAGQNDDFDPAKHWKAGGMPDYTPPKEPFKVVVSFDTEEDRDRFLLENGSPTVHNRTGSTLSVWYPDRPKDDVKSVEFR